MRLRQDLLGCANRAKAASNDWKLKSTELLETWKDSQAELFRQHHIEPTSAKLNKLILVLQAAGELAQSLDKRLYDPDFH